MKKSIEILKKVTLIALVIAISLAFVPFSSALAAGEKPEINHSTFSGIEGIRLAIIWERLQNIYSRQSIFLERSIVIVDKIQERIDQANQNGRDTTQLLSALDTFRQTLKDVNPIHQKAKGIIAAHKGFDDNGKVIDRSQAIETVKSLGKLLKDARSLVKDPDIHLRNAVKAFQDANPPYSSSNNPIP